ncbi:hypothetical protein J2S11_000404 [Bacillus horti]|uniref:Uncharacterized protein n=1 Tax=Caldalkalibacillus horti TaxID=77523 RepID=A0ABT9VV50_9BACI|nr:hypothetical protein [Bacillus horti]
MKKILTIVFTSSLFTLLVFSNFSTETLTTSTSPGGSIIEKQNVEVKI